MHLTNIQQIELPYTHVYISPHLDDAALSCGGAIAAQRAAGEAVLVITLCTAAPAPDSNFSDLAKEFHDFWQLGPEQVVAERLREERVALDLLDADMLWANRLDAIYRYPEAYNSRDTLFHQPAANDPLLPDLKQFFSELRAKLPQATIYAPLGIGLHVDHQLTFQAARATFDSNLVFYEDFPYVAKLGALEERMGQINEPMQPSTVIIDQTLEQKIAAVSAYGSQLIELFGSPAGMVDTVNSYTQRIEPVGGQHGERIWAFAS